MLDVGAIVVEPHLLCRRAFCKEKHVGLDTLRIEYTCGETQYCMKVEILEQFLTNGFSCSVSEQNVVWKHDCGTTSVFEHHHDMLKKVQLVVGRLHIEILSVEFNRAGGTLTERWICKNHINQITR